MIAVYPRKASAVEVATYQSTLQSSPNKNLNQYIEMQRLNKGSLILCKLNANDQRTPIELQIKKFHFTKKKKNCLFHKYQQHRQWLYNLISMLISGGHEAEMGD